VIPTTSVEVVGLAMLVVGLFGAFARLVRGPSLPDRVVALDLIAVITAGFLTIYAVETDQPLFLDAAIVLALITFLGTVALAQYVERRARSE
jgi:multicomponent Na+:H+ antiporter subunit F